MRKPYLAAVSALNKSYIANGVARARADAQRRGSLKEVTLFDEVKARIERGEGVPEVDEPGTPESLKSLRTIYRNALAKITAKRDARAIPIYDMYLNALDAYISELTMGNKLADAHGVKALRDEVVAKKPGAATAVVVSTKPDPPKPATPVTTRMAESKPVGGGSRRDVAKWLVAKGGAGRIAFDNRTEELAREEHIPAGRFELVELKYSAKADHCTDGDFQRLNGQRDLRRIEVDTKGLSDAAFVFLADNRELEEVYLSVDNLGDGIFTHLSGLKKISILKIKNSNKLTGKGMDQLACLPGAHRSELGKLHGIDRRCVQGPRQMWETHPSIPQGFLHHGFGTRRPQLHQHPATSGNAGLPRCHRRRLRGPAQSEIPDRAVGGWSELWRQCRRRDR